MGETSYSNEYRLLERRVKELKENLIKDFVEKDVLNMNKKEIELARAYRLLVHAEFEGYFESIAKKLIEKAIKKWRSQRKANLTIVYLMANFERIEKNESIDTKINKIVKDFSMEVINKNHGIKANNINNMFVPLGIEKDGIDSALLAALDSFGANRGETAHNSGKVQNPIDIKTEVGNVEFILNGIIDIEEQIKRILKS